MFNFLRRKPKEEKKALHSLHSGAWSRVLEPYAGAWQQNIEIRLDSVLAYPAIFSCISLISSDVAKMPINVKRRQSNGVWVNVNNPVLSPLLIKPNFYQTAMQFFELWMISKLSHGNAYILKLRDAGDRVRQLRVLDPRRVIPYIGDDGEIFYSVLTDELNGLSGGLFVPARELIHDRFNTLFHPLCGLSPVYASGLAAIGGEAMLRNSAHTFKNGGRPGGIITIPGSVDADKAKEIKDNWNAGYSGENAGKTALLADGAAFVAVAQSATDSQLVEQLNLSNELVASTFHVPLYKIDTGQSPSYNNIEALEQAYYAQCLQVHMTAIETLIADTFDLDAQTCVEFDHSRLLRMDTAARYKSYSDGIGAGFLAPNEARIKENMDPVEGGDTPYLQQQNYSLEALAKRDAQDNPFSSGSSSSPSQPPPTDDDNGSDTQTDDEPDPNQPLSDDEIRQLNDRLNHKPLFTELFMLSQRDQTFAEVIRQNIERKFDDVQKILRVEFDTQLSHKDHLIELQDEKLREELEEKAKLADEVSELKEILASMTERLSLVEQNDIDEAAIASMVYAQIELPDPPPAPDIAAIVKRVMSEIHLPEPEPLPDIDDMVRNAVEKAREGDLTPQAITELVNKAVDDIEIPEPEPVIPPDINDIIDEVIARLILPEPEPLPDVKALVEKAVGEIRLPQPEPLPDIVKMVKEAIADIPLPEPAPLPDINAMVQIAVDRIELPKAPELPDIHKMVSDAVLAIPFPEPEPLPDIQDLVTRAVAAIELPQPERLPDINQLVKTAVEAIPLPIPEPLPDIQEMVNNAVAGIVLPKPEPLPDIKEMVKRAIENIELPQPEPLPNIDEMVKMAVAEIDLPKPETLPDIDAMVKAEIAKIPLPKPESLPDIPAMISDAIEAIDIPVPDVKSLVEEAVKAIPIPHPEPLPDIDGLVQKAISGISIPQPEPLPDIPLLITEKVLEAINAIELPKPEPLPDIDSLVKAAVDSIELPKPKDPEPLPDIPRLLERALSEYPMPEPEPLPDIEKMVKEAVSAIKLPEPKEPEPLPDIMALVAGAVAGIQFPEPEPVILPDFEKMISEAVKMAVSQIQLPDPGKGEDGKDGLQIEVMPEIDVNKSYPRGTYAIHNGGLWRAYQKTAGMSGFECVVNGLSDIDISLKGDRQFTVSLSKSNGQTETRDFTIPVMIYRDVYQAGQTYLPGDCVTFAGSIWHCYAETTDRPNDVGSTGWRLAVKRGRDGRNRE